MLAVVATLGVLLTDSGQDLLERAKNRIAGATQEKPDIEPAIADPAEAPDGVRVSVDNTGDRVVVSVRTAPVPWRDRLEIEVADHRLSLSREDTEVDDECVSDLENSDQSLITRVVFDRGCLADPQKVTATVEVDGLSEAASAQGRERPNVLFFMMDDMRADELQWMPNVQELIGEQGVTFENGFAGYPLCCPARASVLTGLHAHNHGVWSHMDPWGFTSLDDSSTFATWLQDAGYFTSYLGKYLNGYGDQPEPGNTEGKSTQYCPPGWDLWQASVDGGIPRDHPADGGTYRFHATTVNDNCDGFISFHPQYQSYAFADHVVEQIKEQNQGDQPWLRKVSFVAPHHGLPREPDDPEGLQTPARPRKYWRAFDDQITEAPGAFFDDPDLEDKPKDMQKEKLSDEDLDKVLNSARQRAGSLWATDEAIGDILAALEESGEIDDTLIIFMSDNGYFLGEFGRAAGKILPYEPSLRIPILMRGPGIPHGEVRHDPFLTVDLAQTIADFTGVETPSDLDGQSMLDIARLGDTTAGPEWSRTVLTETAPTVTARKALEKQQPVGARQTEQMRGKVTGIRTHSWMYTEWLPEPDEKKPGIVTELYDMTMDPEQYHNLALDEENSDLVEEFHEVLEQQRRCRGEDCTVVLPESLR